MTLSKSEQDEVHPVERLPVRAAGWRVRRAADPWRARREVNPFLAAAIGGMTCLVLVMVTLNWGLILLTAFTGASVIASGVRDTLVLSPPPTNILFLLLMILGIAWQGATLREKR